MCFHFQNKLEVLVYSPSNSGRIYSAQSLNSLFKIAQYYRPLFIVAYSRQREKSETTTINTKSAAEIQIKVEPADPDEANAHSSQIDRSVSRQTSSSNSFNDANARACEHDCSQG